MPTQRKSTIVMGNRLDLCSQQNFAYKNMWKTSSVKLIIVSVDWKIMFKLESLLQSLVHVKIKGIKKLPCPLHTGNSAPRKLVKYDLTA